MSTNPSDTLYLPEEVAQLLGLHVRTIRRYIREGRLRALRIGNRYRIAAADLENFTGQPITASSAESPRAGLEYPAEVSSIVEVDSIDSDSANQLTNTLLAATKGRRSDDPPLRVDAIYNPGRRRLKLVLTGGIASTAVLLSILSTHLER